MSVNFHTTPNGRYPNFESAGWRDIEFQTPVRDFTFPERAQSEEAGRNPFYHINGEEMPTINLLGMFADVDVVEPHAFPNVPYREIPYDTPDVAPRPYDAQCCYICMSDITEDIPECVIYNCRHQVCSGCWEALLRVTNETSSNSLKCFCSAEITHVHYKQGENISTFKIEKNPIL